MWLGPARSPAADGQDPAPGLCNLVMDVVLPTVDNCDTVSGFPMGHPASGSHVYQHLLVALEEARERSGSRRKQIVSMGIMVSAVQTDVSVRGNQALVRRSELA